MHPGYRHEETGHRGDNHGSAKQESKLLSNAVDDRTADSVCQDSAHCINQQEGGDRAIVRQILVALKSGQHRAWQRGEQPINKNTQEGDDHQ